MKCPEVIPLVPRFFDGELEGRQMRAVALHVTRCADCERELRQLESLQALVGQHVAERVDAVDMSRVWAGVVSRLDQAPLSWSERLRAWWESLEAPVFSGAWPALAGAAAVALLVLGVWSFQGGQGAAPQIATEQQSTVPVLTAKLPEEEAADALLDEPVNSAVFDSIVGSVKEFTVDPDTGTAVLWVSDSGDVR